METIKTLIAIPSAFILDYASDQLTRRAEESRQELQKIADSLQELLS